MIENMPPAMASLNAATTIISSLIGLRDFAKYATQLHELHGHIIKANTTIIADKQAQLVLETRIQEFEKECARLKDWSAEKERYTRKQIATGIFAYIEKDTVAPLQETHKFCCNCFDKTIPSTLQQGSELKDGMGRVRTLICPNGCPPLVIKSYIGQ
jgi:hypothetical protein